VLVVLKLLVLLFFVVIAFSGFHAGNLTPFMPMGVAGVGAAASSIFFSYIGIDAVSTAGDEVKDPRRTLPLGIVLSLLIVTAIYILVALAAVGAQPWTAFAGQEAGLAVILRNLTGQAWTSLILCVGAIVSLGVIILRRTQPDLPRGYRVPLYPVVPLLSVAFCGYLIVGLPLDTWILFAAWVAAACVLYFGYSMRNSKLVAS
jgi:amino acid transporter